MQPNIQAYNYPVQKDNQNQPMEQQLYQQQQPQNQGQGVPLGYPINQQYCFSNNFIQFFQKLVFIHQKCYQRMYLEIINIYLRLQLKQYLKYQNKIRQQLKQLIYQFLNKQYIPVQQQQPFISIRQVNFRWTCYYIANCCIAEIKIKQRANADGCSYPADILCPYCQSPVLTIIKHKSGCHTYLACWLLFLFFLPLFFLPFCFEECQDKIHICPNCGKKVGKKKYKMCC